MWVLIVLTYVFEMDDYRLTEFNRYDTRQQCDINAAVLETTFQNGEVAICYYDDQDRSSMVRASVL